MKRQTIVHTFLDNERIARIIKHNPATSIYCRHDHQIVYMENQWERFIAADRWNMSVERLAQFMKDNGDDLSYVSPSSFAYSLYRKRYAPHDFAMQSGDFRSRFCRDSLYGGRCEVYKIGPGAYHQYDINSSYPWSSLELYFPNPRTLEYFKGSALDMMANIVRHDGVSEVVFSQDRDKPILPVRYKDRVLYPRCEMFRARYTHTELRYALENGVDIHAINKQYVSLSKMKENPFSAFVEYCYDKRYETGDRSWKKILNGLYGRMSIITDDGLMRFSAARKSDLAMVSALPKSHKHYWGVICFGQSMKAPPNGNPLWAAMVLANARVRLHGLIERTNAVYADTDCVITASKQDLPVSNNIGDFKHTSGDYDIKGAKQYLVGETIKLSGVRNPSMSNFYAAAGTSERISSDDGTTKPFYIQGELSL